MVGGLLARCLWGGISWRSLPWASSVPDRCGIFVGRYRPQIPRAFGCQRVLALADLGCTVDHLSPTSANLIPPSSFVVSCDLKALWPGGLWCWGMGGRCPNVAHKAPRKYIHPLAQTHLVDRRHWCIGVWVSVNTVFYRIIRAVAIGTHSGGSFSILLCADCRIPEYVIGEMPRPVFMK